MQTIPKWPPKSPKLSICSLPTYNMRTCAGQISFAKKDMPPKSKADFIKTVTTQADYKREVLEATAPLVVDVYSKCWGPCEMLDDKFQLLYFELAEGSGLKFIRAECDKIGSLAEYKDQSCPTFMIYKDGQVVETIVGPKIAALANTVKRICGAEAPPAPAAE